MSYSANQYNHATPLSSVNSLINASTPVVDAMYFVLSENAIDGSYVPISGDVGIWSSSLSDINGVLPEPFIVTLTEDTQIGSITIVGAEDNYPVSFTIEFYTGSTLLYSISEDNNTSYRYTKRLPEALTVSSYTISVSRISAPNSAARLYNVYRMTRISSSDTLHVADLEYSKTIAQDARLESTDTCFVGLSEKSYSGKRIIHANDAVNVGLVEINNMRNIHTIMKSPSRRIFGKVYITYTDPLVEVSTSVSANSEAYNSRVQQLLEGAVPTGKNLFTLYRNDLSGRYSPITEYDHVGWTSAVLSDANGYFSNKPSVEINFVSRPLTQFTLHLDDTNGCLIEDFVVTFRLSDNTTISKSIIGNRSNIITILSDSDDAISNVVAIIIEVSRISKPFYPATIFTAPTQSVFLYVGYQDKSDLVSIDLLEELTYEDEIEALGGMSANEIVVVLDNSYRAFNANNPNSPVASKLLRNRKIVPYLGAEISPGHIEWYTLGTFWSYKWDVPFNSLTASVVGFDTIGLLAHTRFTRHSVMTNRSLGSLIDLVLNDAKGTLPFLEWEVSGELYNVVVPYAWFMNDSHAAALQRISRAYPMHIYCDRNGKICAAPQRLNLDYYYDVWSDSTNVVDKTYSSLNTVLPNSVYVTVINPVEMARDVLVDDRLQFDIAEVPTYTLNFNKPYIKGLVIEIDKDGSVDYTYEVFSWGITFKFSGTGIVRSIKCTGTSLDTSNTSIVSRMNQDSISLNGVVKREVSSEFIQTSSLAAYIIARIFSLSEADKYDVEVSYRGDISLSINEPIRLLDGIAPDDRYNIKRHQLTWDGALTGIAHLNT